MEIKRIVVVSSWRSGSSLIGGLFDSHPGAWPQHPSQTLFEIKHFTAKKLCLANLNVVDMIVFGKYLSPNKV